MSFLNFAEPVTLVRSPTLMKAAPEGCEAVVVGSDMACRSVVIIDFDAKGV